MEDRLKQLEDSIKELKAENRLLKFNIDELYIFKNDAVDLLKMSKDISSKQLSMMKPILDIANINYEESKKNSQEIQGIKKGKKFNELKGTEKISVLDKLGILTYLQSIGNTPEDMADFVSQLLGLEEITAAKYIGAIVNKQTKSKSYPGERARISAESFIINSGINNTKKNKNTDL